MLEADGDAVEDWLLSPKFEAHLFLIFPCTDITPSLANKVWPLIADLKSCCMT